MLTQAKKAYGLTVRYGNGASPEVFTAIPEVVDVTGLETIAQELEVTNHDSPLETAEFVKGMKVGAQVEIQCNLTHPSRVIIDALAASATNVNFKVTLPTTTIPHTCYFPLTPLGQRRFQLQPNQPMQIALVGRVAGAIVVTP